MSRARYENSRKVNPSSPIAGSNSVGPGDDFSRAAASYARDCEKRDAQHAKQHEAQFKKLDNAVPEEKAGRG
jgi:hypothetical protein